ncbi:hypothetical protein QO003_000410 [Arthrobacter silviterrae]|uniref:DUF4190 domain-containing protein n=1 Tax=Arthrobacter silviterrae TaxID=2026658 RepID=A0ABX0D6S5_9MICC|nr:DUF4190 domain-containing protein [Arthrobacter silviterrae]MDQ0276107.1 hypothetical protein [Arthrobacter silviterrae]NGN82572.1 DUF4190 domain-containing protein [Arthrobacter silviterrae]
MTSNTPENPYGQPAPQAPYAQPAPYGQQPAPYGQQPYGAPAEDPGKTLGIVGLVLCFVFSLAGLIVSIIAKKKSTAAGFKNTPANVGVILGWIFTILGLIVAVIYIIAIVALLNNPGLVSN